MHEVRFAQESLVLGFVAGRPAPLGDWGECLVRGFEADFDLCGEAEGR